MNVLFSPDLVSNAGWGILLLPICFTYLSEKRKLGHHLSLLFSIGTWFWILFSANVETALFGLSFCVLASVFYVFTSLSRKDFSVLGFQIFWALFLATILWVGGIPAHDFSWTSWNGKFEGDNVLLAFFFLSSFLQLLGITDEETEGRRERFLLLYFWPQAICLQLLSRFSIHQNGSVFFCIIAFILAVFSYGIGKPQRKRRALQAAIYALSISCLLSGLIIQGQALFLTLSLANLFLSQFELSSGSRKLFFGVLAASFGMIGFLNSGIYIRIISFFWARPVDLVAFCAAILAIQSILWSEALKPVQKERGDRSKEKFAFIFLGAALLVQLGIFLTGAWSGRVFEGDSDLVWTGLVGHWTGLGEFWAESVSVQVSLFVVSLALGYFLRSDRFTWSPFFPASKARVKKFFAQNVGALSNELEKNLVRIEGLDGELAKFGVVAGKLGQLVLNGGILRNLVIWFSGLAFLFLHFYRS